MKTTFLNKAKLCLIVIAAATLCLTVSSCSSSSSMMPKHRSSKCDCPHW
ncbi:MAG: hypothetical protein IJ250_02295 [Bacteroidales bacterium]|nr:hypothetical protein [Bacteroidales bacterium]